MSQQRKVRRKSELSQRDDLSSSKRKDKEPTITRISKIAIMLALVATIVSLAYTIILLANY